MHNIQKMPIRSHKQIDFYNRAYAASLTVHKLAQGLPKIEQWVLADQMRRASRSICANVAEGFSRGRESSQEFKRFLQMAMSSAEEMQVWLDYCVDLGYVTATHIDPIRQDYSEINKMIYAFKRNME